MTRSVLIATCTLILLSGCGNTVPVEVGLHPNLSMQVTDAIASINEFNRVADRTPENLRAAADKVIDKLKIEGRDFLAHDARHFTDHTLASAGAVSKGAMEFVDQKMKAYLEALKKGLEDALPKIKAEKSRDKAIELLRNIKVDVKPLDPFVELVNPNSLTLNNLQTHTGQSKGLENKSPLKVELSGFGFLRPDGEPTEYRVEVVGAKDTRVLPTDKVVSQSGPFILIINLSYFTPVDGDQKLLVSWGKKKLADIPFITHVVKDSPPPPQPAPPPKITEVTLYVGTSKNDKDKEITFHYTVHRRSDGKQVGGISVGRGESWPDDKKPNPSWRHFKITINDSDKFTEADRQGYRLHVRYDSYDGDPNWIGRLRADAVVEGGKIIAVLGETEDFEMGHLKGHPEHENRDFDFNK